MRVITGKARGVALKTPEGLTTRPTADRVKEALFSIINFDIPDAEVLDLFGGTGQLGIEALSRGAKRAVFVDAGDAACKLIRENLRRTKLEGQGSVVFLPNIVQNGKYAASSLQPHKYPVKIIINLLIFIFDKHNIMC